ncbi:MAG: hypothetical protein WCF06_03155 [Nitrososphaeraceae archaeon]|jgi:hypothetical protein
MLSLMRISGKRILVIVIMGILVSSVVAGAVSYFNRSSITTANNNQTLLNARINNVVNFCLRSLPNGTAACDSQLGPVLTRICNNEQQPFTACHDGKVVQYYKIRNNEIAKRSAIVNKSSNNSTKK